MVKVHLHGKLGTLFGKLWELDVKSPAEALRAIDINTKGKLSDYLRGPGGKKYYKVAIQKKTNIINPIDELKLPSGQSDIFFIPTIKGAGGDNNGGVLQIIEGVVLIIIGIVIDVYAEGSTSSLTEGMYIAGAGMILGGIVQLLTPVPKAGEDDGGPRGGVFQGNATSIQQGGSVPIVYGQVLVIPMPISISTTNKNIGEAFPPTVFMLPAEQGGD